MAWETRKGTSRRYYTRSYKRGGRVYREYVGGGMIGELSAERDAQAAAERAARRMRDREASDQLRAIDATMQAAHQWMQDELRRALTAAGFQQHDRGEWRRPRGETGKDSREV